MTKAADAMTPVFVGTDAARPLVVPEVIYSYMTAEQMQSKVTALTGYEHPGFITYANILGHNDPKTGARTTSEPTLLSVLLMQKIATDIAAMVLEREQFLSDGERVVFPGIDLTQTPTPAALEAFWSGLYRRWLNIPLSAFSLRLLLEQFNQALSAKGPAAAYQAVLALMLEHGGLYYI